MLFSSPIPFREALQSRAVRSILPTVLSSAELSQVAVALRERAVFSARVIITELLDGVDRGVSGILQGKVSPDLPTVDLPSVRLELKEILKSVDYRPAAEDVGTLKDLRTDARLNLILETNTKMAQGYGQWEQGQDDAVLDEWPCQELVRAEDRVERRNWYERWRGAGGTIYPGTPRGLPLVQGAAMEGRCIARKDAPIWSAISRFGQPYPPFDFNSGVDVRDVSRAEAMELGIIDRDTRVQRQSRGFNADLQATPDVRAAELRNALEAEGYEFDGDVLMPREVAA